MRFITWNVNGIRAVERKGELARLVDAEHPDFLFLQEIKGAREQFGPYLTDNPNYEQFYHSAEKKGYAGSGLWVARDVYASLADPTYHTDVPHMPNADEGRISWLSFGHGKKTIDLLSVYFPNGGKSEQAWKEKLEFYDAIHAHINRLREAGHLVVVGGDMNVAHNEIDIARPKENDGKIGFHPDERAWMDRMTADGWVDAWRALHPDTVDVYSYWDLVTRARERNVGWRIDYYLVDRALLDRVTEAEYLNAQMGSDHCPLRMELELPR